MDLNEAMSTACNGGKVRDDLNMREGWSMMFFADDGQADRKPHDRTGKFYYVDPLGNRAHLIKFTDAHRASVAWKTMP